MQRVLYGYERKISVLKMFLWTVFQVDSFLLVLVLWSAVCHPFPRLTWGSSTNRVAQTTNVMFAILFLISTSKGLTRITYFIIMTSLLIIVTKQTSKEKYRKIMTIKIWSWFLDKLWRSGKSCLHAWFINMGGHLWL